MNTSNIKKYAPKARADFMAAVAKRSHQFGAYADMQITFGDLLVDVKSMTGKK